MRSGALAGGLTLAILAAGCGGEPLVPLDPVPPLERVNPFIGSAGKYFGYGSVFVGAALPFGLARPGPDTTTENGALVFHHFSGYYHEDELVNGFSQVHISGTGAADYGALLLMPSDGFDAARTRESGYRARLDKASEQASPGHYAVTLADSGIGVELTASRRCAWHRYRYPATVSAPAVVLDLAHAIADCSVSAARLTLGSDGAFSGWLDYHGSLTGRSGGLRLFFDGRLLPAPQAVSSWADADPQVGPATVEGARVGAGFVFPAGTAEVQVQLGLSIVDEAGARGNREAELTDWDFEAALERARAAWAESLGRVRIGGGQEHQRVKFYTALYHALLHPTVFSDVDGRYTGLDRQVHTAAGFEYHSDFSLWDTYRCVHSLFDLLFPERQRDLLRSLLAMKQDGGFLPRWPAGTSYTGCMIGTPADVVFAESVLKGITDFDTEAAFAAVVENATQPLERIGRPAVARYLELGYVPSDEQDSASALTLEYAVADAAIAAWAGISGHSQEAAAFGARASALRHLFDPDQGLVRGRRADGAWAEPDEEFDPLAWADYYVEGDAWQYTWLVPHDPELLVELFGSAGAMADKLEAFFATPEPPSDLAEFLPKYYYWHGNEPDIHSAYLFHAAGRSDRAQYWVRQILEQTYGDGPDGIPGNDDLGTMSAWFAFSALGFYPSAGQDWYWLGSPLFERAELDLGSGRVLELRASGAGERPYVRRVWLDGHALERPILRHAELLGADRLEFEMAAEPSDWAP